MRNFLRLGATILGLAVLTSPQSGAFSSFEIFGGAYHVEITEKGLEAPGFSSESLHWVSLGNVSMDKFYSKDFSDDRRHFTDMTFDESEDFLEDQLEKIVEDAGRARDDYQAYRKTLMEFGAYLHTVQDFYAHTNWIEKSLSLSGGGIVELAPIDFDDFPFEIVSPYTLNHYLPPGEARDVVEYQREFGRSFYSVEELDILTDRERIELVASPKKALNHLTLAKDNPAYHAGRLRWSEGGPTLFEIASDLATRETLRQWNGVKEALLEEYDGHGPAIVRTLQQGWATDFPLSQGGMKPEVLLENGELRLSHNLTLTVNLILKPKRWDRSGARQAMKIFTRLSRPESEKNRFLNEGVRNLEMLRDDKNQNFHLRFESDLYGSSRTLLKLRPLGSNYEHGEWEALLTLPDELIDIGRLSFHSRGELRIKEGQNKLPHASDIAPWLKKQREVLFVIKAPRGGWDPPRWLEQYLQDT